MPRRRRSKTNKSFVMVGRRMLLKCDEWRNLAPAAKMVYIYLKAKYNGSNNGNIRLYYSELNGVKGISSDSTISKALKELEKKGWIKRRKLGGLYRYFNEYELTGTHDDYIISRY